MTCPKCGKRIPCVDSREDVINTRYRRYKCRFCDRWVYTVERIYTERECFGSYATGRSEADANDG